MTSRRSSRPAAGRWLATALAAVLALVASPAPGGAGAAIPARPSPAAVVPVAAVGPRAGHGAPEAPGAPDLVALETPGSNDRVSVGPNEAELAGFRSDSPVVSASGRFVAYHFHYQTTSAAGAIQSIDGIIRFDRRTRTPVVIWPIGATSLEQGLVSRQSLAAYDPTISADGSLVAFVLRPSEGATQIGIWDAATGKVGDVFAGDKVWSGAAVDEPHLAADGTAMAFRLFGSGRTTGPGIYVLDRATGAVATVAAGPPGSNDYWGELDISGDGQVVAFSSGRALFDTANSDHIPQVWRIDLTSGGVTLLSAGTDGGIGTSRSDRPAVDGDGSIVAFESDANNLLPGDLSDFGRVYAWSSAGGLRRISTSTSGGVPSGASGQAAVSANGRYAAFTSDALDIVPGDTTGRPLPGTGLGGFHTAAFVQTYPGDIFVVDLVNGRTSRVSVGTGPADADGGSGQPDLSSTGRFVAFESLADNLVEGDANKSGDAFVRDRTPGLSATPSALDFGSVVPGPPGVTRLVTVASTGSSGARVTAVRTSGPNAGDWLPSDDRCTGVTLYPGDPPCTIKLLFVATQAGRRTATLVVTQTAPDSPLTVRLTGASGAGTITVDPKVGPPGTVTVVTGTGFPHSSAVTLRWSTGITPAQLTPVVTDAKGGFTAQMLVLPRDVTGRRTLRVTVILPGTELQPATAPFLVVDGTAVPPTSGLVQVFFDAVGRPIILRR